MSTTTTNYGLIKPALTDSADITQMNPNWDNVDTKLKEIETKLTNHQHDEYLPLSGGEVTGTLIVSKVMGANGDSYTSPALVVGGKPNTHHLELDNNEIQAKQNETTTGNLFLNSNGGKVTVGEGGLGCGGAIKPETAINLDVGGADLPWNNTYSRYFNVYGGANAQYGRLRAATTGTTSAEGIGALELGNATPTGTAHNASGKITMYGKGTGFTNILPNNATSGSNSVTLPTANGTMAVFEASTTDLTAGTSALETGKLYFVYE